MRNLGALLAGKWRRLPFWKRREATAHGTAHDVGQHWDNITRSARPVRTRWWESPCIRAHCNRVASGDGAVTLLDIAKAKANDRRFERGVSVGCGDGSKEMALILGGLVGRFELFELSAERRAAAAKKAEALGVSDVVSIRGDDAFSAFSGDTVDFVHWNNSLHHMLDVPAAVAWSHRILKPGGMFYMDDFVGPDRFQWSDASCEFASFLRGILPERYMRNPHRPGESSVLSRIVRRPNPVALAKADPSEAADSSRILRSIYQYFPDADVVLTGGLVYHLTLNDVLHNIDETNEHDRLVLDLLLVIDQLCTYVPEFDCHYATALALKRVGP